MTQRDYYSLAAFFLNTTQRPLDGNVADTPPSIVVPRKEDRARWTELVKDVAAVEARQQELRDGSNEAFEQWLASEERGRIAAPLDFGEVLSLDLRDRPRLLVKGKLKKLKLSEGVTLGRAPRALRFGGERPFETKRSPVFRADRPFSMAAWFYLPKTDASYVLASKADSKEKGRGWVLSVGGTGRVPNFSVKGDDGKGLSIAAGHVEQLKPGTWNYLAVSYDGSREQLGLALYVNGNAVTAPQRGVEPQLEGSISNKKRLRLGSGTKMEAEAGALADFRVL